jgi:predicted Zn finger-like uncharacterized protein
MADPVIQQCPHCEARYQIGPNEFGRQIRCAKCGKEFQATLPPLPFTPPPIELPRRKVDGGVNRAFRLYSSVARMLGWALVAIAAFKAVVSIGLIWTAVRYHVAYGDGQREVLIPGKGIMTPKAVELAWAMVWPSFFSTLAWSIAALVLFAASTMLLRMSAEPQKQGIEHG